MCVIKTQVKVKIGRNDEDIGKRMGEGRLNPERTVAPRFSLIYMSRDYHENSVQLAHAIELRTSQDFAGKNSEAMRV